MDFWTSVHGIDMLLDCRETAPLNLGEKSGDENQSPPLAGVPKNGGMSHLWKNPHVISGFYI